MWSSGESLQTITKTLKRSYDTVHRVLDGPPSSKRQGAPRRLSDQQEQQLLQVATTEKLTAKQLKSKLGYECSTRTIQRVLVEHAGHKRRRGVDDSSNSETENGYEVVEEQVRSGTETTMDSDVVGAEHNPIGVVVNATSETSSGSDVFGDRLSCTVAPRNDSTQLLEQPRLQIAEAAIGVASPASPPRARRVELVDVIQAQNELLDGVIARLDRQASTMEILLRHVSNVMTHKQ
ncbi:hypothetical protein V7S43_013653 [Phytophthora oleae]|uniref:Transposase Tc1-like domain-containing protein n=1 Tax=Phytophthora oleae TaxID=2107226 RepID=A0ABD3F3X7_9STRA